MPEVLIKDQIKKLIEIQKVDKEIYDYRVELDEKPKIIEELKQHFEVKKEHLNRLEEKLKKVLLERKQKEVDLQAKEEQIAKANAALNALKTNKEYQAKISEIENLKADKSRIEEAILICYDDAEKVSQDVAKEKGVVSKYEAEYQQKKKEVETVISDLKGKVSSLESQRSGFLQGIEKDLLAKYEKLLQKSEGVAIVPVTSNSCGGCFMNLNPQMLNTIRLGQEIVRCEYCTRMLYLEEEL